MEIAGIDVTFANALLGSLLPQQNEKLLTLALRQVGPSALADNEIAKTVGLIKAQPKKIAALVAERKDRQVRFDEMVASGLKYLPEDPKDSEQERQRILKSYDSERDRLKHDLAKIDNEILRVLTPAQLKKWQSLSR